LVTILSLSARFQIQFIKYILKTDPKYSMRNVILILILFIITKPNCSLGQQDPQFSNYFYNQQYYNPSVVTNESLPKIQLLHRSQYLGYISNFDEGGTLNSQLLSAQMPLAKAKAGIGLIIINDQAGLEKNQQLRFSLAKTLKTTNGNFSIGVSAGFYSKSFSDKFRPRESNDPSIPVKGFSQLKPDFGIGAQYSSRFLFGGIGINHLNNPKFDFGGKDGNSIINRNFTGFFGLNLPVNTKLEIKPNLLFRTDLQTTNLEGGLLAELGNKYWMGANYRSNDAAILLIGANLMKNNSLKIGAAYDIVTSKKAIKSSSSIEIMASYILGTKSAKVAKPQSKMPVIRTPRYRH
jgi:type IX secretion system PorP/SprF family membrane protein